MRLLTTNAQIRCRHQVPVQITRTQQSFVCIRKQPVLTQRDVSATVYVGCPGDPPVKPCTKLLVRMPSAPVSHVRIAQDPLWLDDLPVATDTLPLVPLLVSDPVSAFVRVKRGKV